MIISDIKGPHDLPRLRLFLLDLWRKGGGIDTAVGTGQTFMLPGQTKDPAGNWGDWERRHLANADLWWVSADMTDLTQVVSKSIPGDTTPLDLRPPSDSGLVVFEKPWFGQDANNAEIKVAVSAVLWGQTRLGELIGRPEPYLQAISFSCYEYLPAYIEYIAGDPAERALRMDQTRRFLDSGGEIMGVKYRGHSYDKPDEIKKFVLGGREALGLGPNEEDEGDRVHLKLQGGSSWLPLGRSDWPICDHLTDHISGVVSDDTSRDLSFQEDRRMMAAFWSLIHTTRIAAVSGTHAPREVRRKYERAGHPASSSNVRIIQLRKTEPREAPDTPENGHKQVEWSCQWPVSAHTRLQPYGPGRSLRKLIVVGPFLKGPSDKPLRVRQEVKAFVK